MIFNNEAIPHTEKDPREVILRPVGFPPYRHSSERIGFDYSSYFLIRDFVADEAYRYFMDLVDKEYDRIDDMYHEMSGRSSAYKLNAVMVYRCANEVASDYHARISNDELELYAMNIELTNRTEKGLDSYGFMKLVVKSLIALN